MPVNPALHAEASNPSTDPARLAAIAAESPELGSVIAANPAAYDGLLDWLAQYGDAAAQQAVAVRRGTAAPATAPVTPAATPASVTTAAAAPFAAQTPRAPLSAGAKRGILFGGIGLVALAVIAVVAVVVVNILGGGSSAAAVRTAEITSEPRDDAWELISPLAEDADDDDSLSANVYTVGQDRALVQWTSSSEDSLTSLVDTRGGSILWTIDDFPYYMEVVSAPGVNPILVQSSDGEDEYNYDTIYAVDAGNGEVLSDTSDLDDAYLITESSFGYDSGALSGDVLLRTDDGIGLYSPQELDEEKWMIDLGDDDTARVAGNRIIVNGEEAYDARSGEEVEWDGDEDIEYFGINGQIYGREGEYSDGDLYAFTESGEEKWNAGFTGYLFYYDTTRIGFFDDEGEELQMLDLRSGEELWTIDIDYNDGYTFGGSEGSGIMIIPAGKDDESTAFDLSNGDELFSFQTSEDGDWGSAILGDTPAVFYVFGGEDRDLIAYSTREGDELWSLSGDDNMEFALAGGNLVSILWLSGEDAQDDAVLRGIQP